MGYLPFDMEANPYTWSEVEEDNPIEGLYRRKVWGDKALVAKVSLKKGCTVSLHHHASEQMSVILSGHVRWTIGDPGEEIEMRGGQMIHIPSDVPHALVTLEDTEVIDMLSPAGPMGVDSQGR